MFIVWAFRHGLVPSGGFVIVVIVTFPGALAPLRRAGFSFHGGW
jgi:hypothetical protein